MEFVDMINPENEELCGLESILEGNDWVIRWIYPLAYEKVIIFKVEEGDVFTEERALADDYECRVLRSPVSTMKGMREEECSYYFFPCNNSEERLIRQKENAAEPPVCVRYHTEIVESPGKTKGFRLFKKEKTEGPYTVLKICSDKNLKAECVAYRIGAARADFTFPKDFQKGTMMEFRLKRGVTLKAMRPNILLEETTNLK